MKAKGIFISTLLVIDTFFVSYAVGFQSRHVLIVNPKLPPVVQKKVEAKPIPAAVPAKKADTKNTHAANTHAPKTQGKGVHKAASETTSSKAPAADATKPAAKPAVKPAAKPTTKAAAKPVAKPVVKPASESKQKSPADQKPGA
jgi:hypothetical protein